ncbi:MAG: hypothetical protein WC376_05490, partial [Candidatus Nanoarchaeia archaeon]
VFDDAGNVKITEFNNISILDYSELNISLLAPLDNSYINHNTISFNYSYSGGLASNCSIYLDTNLEHTINYPENDTILTYNASLSDDYHTWFVECTHNSSGISYQSNVFAFTIDTVAPLVDIASPENMTYNNVTQLVDITTDSDAESVWFFNGTENMTYTVPVLITFAEGINTIIAYVNDSLGNLNWMQVSFTIDTIAPSLEIISPVNATYNNATQLVNISSDGENVWYNWNGTNYTYTSELLIDFAEGSNTLDAWANDSAGNTNYSSIAFTVDTVAPSLEIITPVNTVYNNATQLVNISSDGANVWYNYNGTNITYISPLLITFAEGTNTLQAWANDEGNNFNYISVSFTIDTITPNLEIIAPKNSSYNNATQLVNISATDDNLDSVWYNYNGTNITYTSPVLVTFAEGTNTLDAWANDSAGNLNYTNVSFTIDTITPNLEIISPINITYNTTTQLVNISSDGANVWYNYNGTNITYTAPINITFAEGTNTLDAWANDSAGNTNYSNIAFTIDTTAPNLEIITPVNTFYNNATQLVNISSDGINVWYNWNGTYYNYTAPLLITFAEGTNILQAWANDEGNNFNHTSITFTIDTITPNLEIITPQNSSYNNATQLVNISATDDNLDNVWYNWNGINITYTAPINITFAEGSNTLDAWANDSAGNTNYS